VTKGTLAHPCGWAAEPPARGVFALRAHAILSVMSGTLSAAGHTSYAPARGGSFFQVDFDQTPFTVAWEITHACAPTGIHCRAEAVPHGDPRELTTDEASGLIDQVVDVGSPILVVTGDDPLMRPDVYDLLGRAVQRGLPVALSPSATRRLTRAALERARAAGAHMLRLSLDSSSPEVHASAGQQLQPMLR
jgi:Radical SAM superfamily